MITATDLELRAGSRILLSGATLRVQQGDRIGLVGYDTRAVVELAADTGHHHYLQLVDKLLDVRALVDEDLTDVTAGELVARLVEEAAAALRQAGARAGLD